MSVSVKHTIMCNWIEIIKKYYDSWRNVLVLFYFKCLAFKRDA